MLRKAVEVAQGRAQQIAPGALAERMSEYAGLLAGQGSLHTAVSYLGSSSEVRARLLWAKLKTCLTGQA